MNSGRGFSTVTRSVAETTARPMITEVIEFLLHLDRHLNAVIESAGPWAYVIFFLVIFCETGLVITPFLPGDSLLFALGAIAAGGEALNIVWLLSSLTVAAIAGDSVNYTLGRFFGPKIFSRPDSWLLNRKHLDRTRAFYERYGGKTIIIARFLPIIRTFAPFVAGIGTMSYSRFMTFNVVGGILWVGSMTMAGYLFGNLDFVKKNFTLVILAIIFISTLPGVIEFLRERARLARESRPGEGS